MADNTVLNAGSLGDTIASDDIGGVKFQRIKLVHGADGVNAGDVSTANPLPVTVSNPTTNPETGLAKDGTDITTPTAMPVGGIGIRGWLSAIWTKLNGTLGVTGAFFQATQPVSLATAPSTPVTNVGTFSVQAAATLTAETTKVIGTVNILAANLVLSTTAAAAAAVTVTLPAVVGQFHYITRINILKYAAAAVVGAAVPVLVTSTNFASALAWTTPTAQAIGTQYETDIEPASPIKSLAANTATTIVCPAITGIIWRVSVYYYTAP